MFRGSYPGVQGPEPLWIKYRPQRISDFVGLPDVKEIMEVFVSNPYSSAWLFVGPPGSGKTSMASVVAKQLNQVDTWDFPPTSCDVETLKQEFAIGPGVMDSQRYYRPGVPYYIGADLARLKWKIYLFDEIDEVSRPAGQTILARIFDPIYRYPWEIFLATCNNTRKLDPKVIDRCQVLQFDPYGNRKELIKFLAYIWSQEAPGTKPPNLETLVKNADDETRAAMEKQKLTVRDGAGVRAALIALQTELTTRTKR